MKEIKGLSGARGQALGKAIVLKDESYTVECVKVEDAEAEAKKLEDARNQYRVELDELFEKTKKEVNEEAAGIFAAYKEMVNDDFFFENPVKRAKKEQINIEFALEEEKKTTAGLFMQMDDPYMKERGADIENVCNALIRKMLGIQSATEQVEKAEEEFVLVAEDLTPADTVRLDKRYLRGFATEKGGQTSHTVILAKTLGIPAVVGAEGLLAAVEAGDVLYVDGSAGTVIVDPEQEMLDKYEEARKKMERQKELLGEVAALEAVTTDGHSIEICVNAGDKEGIDLLNMEVCDGIGLFRTEFLYMAENQYPSEELQFETYKKLAEKTQGKETIVRTLDIGGDKKVDYMELPQEFNPFLGYRAIRLCLDRREVFKTQLRAILRASAFGKLSIMFPMIVNLEELRTAKALAEECKEELRAEGKAFNENIRMGIMIETPAAVLLSDRLAKEADFFSIGTNDLIQYVTATDRMNEKIQYLYRICNVSVLRAVKQVAENAHKAGIPIGICGESASDERLTPVWLGLGIDELSMVSSQTARIKYIVRHMSKERADEITAHVCELDTAEEIESYLEEQLKVFEEIL